MPLFALSSIFLLAITFSPSSFGNPANFGTFPVAALPARAFSFAHTNSVAVSS